VQWRCRFRRDRKAVNLLTFFRPAANKDYKPVAIFAEVNPAAGTKIDPVLVNTGLNALGVGKIALLDACLEQPPLWPPLLCSDGQTKRLVQKGGACTSGL